MEQVDLSNNHFDLAPMLVTDTQTNLFNAIISNIKNNETLFNSVSAGVTPKLNEVIDAVNTLQVGAPADFEKLQQDINAILYLESEAGNDSFVGAFQKLFDAVNNRKEVNAFKLPITASTNGRVTVDLSAYGFTTTNEFIVIAELETVDNGRNVDVTFKKVSPTEGELLLRDGDRITSTENAESFYEAQTKGLVSVIITIVRSAKPISAKLTPVNSEDTVFLGNVDEFGEEFDEEFEEEEGV